MGRWRPPQPKGSPYITRNGFEHLQEELKAIWVRRADVVKALSAAAAEGDRSENAEYIYRKKELGGIDRRIGYLQRRMPDLNIVDQAPQQERVFFGAWVKLKPTAGKAVEYRIVGADEADADTNSISVDSPLAQALLKKNVDDKVQLNINQDKSSFVIKNIRYE